ncbi:T9SS type A sorting domain-containing protein [Aquimarina sp. AU119]|uniref:T9SS type A sorting domain-containing protein n=1 Tax=Aquimarina sp. AU119 TaxID=2108528 RepID=UPI000D69EECD|nr:T9SS type A sorting domain-containing protein [Aquimarina sp. AU119]
MRKFYFFIFIILSFTTYGQNVTTILNSPEVDIDDALALDSKGNLYGSNFVGNTVYKITPKGKVSTFVTGLQNPNGLAFDSWDNLFVAEYGGRTIRKYDTNGSLVKSFPLDSGIPSGMIKSLYRNTIIYTDVQDNGIKELFPDGTIKVLYQGVPLDSPVGLAFDRRGALYIGNFNNREIYKLSSRKKELEYVATVPDSGTDFPFLAFLAYANGSLFGTNYGEHKIYKINPRAIDDVEIYAGSSNGNADGNISEATFSYPAGIISNRSGSELYVSEFSGLGNVRKISRRKRRCDFYIGLKAYPNPVSEILNVAIDSKEKGTFKIKIYDLFGRKLVFQSEETNETEDILKTIKVEGWKRGFYKLEVSKGSCKRYKLIIVR